MSGDIDIFTSPDYSGLLHHVEMPFPPSVNSMYMQGKNHGQKFPTKKLKEFQKEVTAQFSDDDREPYFDFVIVNLILYPPDKRTRDIDNYIKAPLDMLTKLRYIADDSQIVNLTVSKMEPIKGKSSAVLYIYRSRP